MPRIKPIRLLLPSALALLVLGGCATTPPPAPEQARERPAQAAQRLITEGRTGTAARRLEEAAEQAADSDAADTYRLQAAVLYTEVARNARARRLLEAARAGGVAGDARTLTRLLDIRLAETPPQPAETVSRLSPVPDGLAAAMTAAWLATLADAELATGNAMQAARHRADRQRLLGAAAVADNDAVWQALSRIDSERLRRRVPATRPDTFGAWLELAWAVRSNTGDAEALRSAVDDWRARYPQHPAARGDFASELLRQRERALTSPESVALLLPLSGELEDVGKAIRDGFLTSFYAQPTGQRPALEILDTQGSPAGAVAAYRQAGKADALVGPLTKASVREVFARHTGERPLLALNTVSDTSTPQGTYQFGLAPEDDARTAAQAAWQSGIERAVILAPRGKWGERVAQAYRAGFTEAGGRILEVAYYARDEADYSDALRGLFNLDAGKRRARELRQLLRRDLQFTPNLRADMQAVFVAAFPREARLIVPQIRFYQGLELPVYATAHAYPRPADKATRRDLEDVHLVELPWLIGPPPQSELATLRTSSEARWPQSSKQLPGLVAMGVDAHRLLTRLGALQFDLDARISGATGTLTMDEASVIHRTPVPVEVTMKGLQPTRTLAGRDRQNENAAAPVPVRSIGASADARARPAQRR